MRDFADRAAERISQAWWPFGTDLLREAAEIIREEAAKDARPKTLLGLPVVEVPEQRLRDAATEEQLERDRKLYGNSFEMRMADGRRARIDPLNVAVIPSLFWTKDPPKEPGWYWRRRMRDGPPELCVVNVFLAGRDPPQPWCSGYPLSDSHPVGDGCEWCGPIRPPISRHS